MMITPEQALQRAAKKVGGFSALAERLHVSRQAAYKWLENGVPPERCTDIERVSGVRRELLRPDIFGRPSRGRENAHAAA